MAQIRYTCSVTHNSASIVIAGEDATITLGAGDWFHVLARHGVYEVAAVASDGTDTTVTLTAPYRGATASDAQGLFEQHGGFTSRGYPLPAVGDLDIPVTLARTIQMLNEDVQVHLGTQHVYTDTTAGLAATSDGEHFFAPGTTADVYLTLYRNDAGTATTVSEYPGVSALQAAIAEMEAMRLALETHQVATTTALVNTQNMFLEYTGEGY